MNHKSPLYPAAAGRTDQGAALVMSLIAMLVFSIIVIGYSTDTDIDLIISRNLERKNQALNWADTGIDIAEEMLAYSVDTRVMNTPEDEEVLLDTTQGAASPVALHDTLQAVAVTFDEVTDTDEALVDEWDYHPLYLSTDGLIYICDTAGDSARRADVAITHKGSQPGEGGSIIIAAGYEGVGKGAGAAGGFQSFFQLESQGYHQGNSCQTIGAMYRHVLR